MDSETKQILLFIIVFIILTGLFSRIDLSGWTHDRLRRQEKEARDARDKAYRDSLGDQEPVKWTPKGPY